MSTSIPLPRMGIDLLSDETQMPAGTVRADVQTNKAFWVWRPPVGFATMAPPRNNRRHG